MTKSFIQVAMNESVSNNESDLWENYKKTGDIVLRNKLVMLYTDLVEIIVKKMYYVYSNKSDIDDILNNAMIALIKAVETFEPFRGIKFGTYASIRIKGSIIDYIRAQDWIPRTVREKSKKIEKAYNELKDKLLREPTYEEIADILDLPTEKIGEYFNAIHSFNILSLDEIIIDKMESFESLDPKNKGPQYLLMKKELTNTLSQAISTLSEKEKLVVTLFYFEELKIKEIAEIMEITSSRVSQIHSMALLKIKSKLKDYINS